MDKRALAQATVADLSVEETRFLRGLVAGDSHGAIASRLNLAQDRANAVRQRLMRMLGAGSTADAVRMGIYAGL